MKKLIFTFSLFAFFTLSAQKNIGGKIYDKHPALDVVDAFTKAFVAGDEATMRSLTTDDFKWWQMNVMDPKPSPIENLIGRSKYFSENMINFNVKNRGQAYSDAIEFKGADRVDVYTYQMLTGVDKKTGVILKIPRNSIFNLTKDGKKITRLSIMDSQLKWNKAYEAYNTKKNGTIYVDHPFISKVRLLYAHIMTGDLEAMRSLYADNASISDAINSEEGVFFTPDEEIENLKKFLETYEVLDVTESGYPDLLEYEGTETQTIISWWDLTIKNKKSGKRKKHSNHSQVTLNKEGKIIREVYYYNAAHLPK
ncbi:MAG: hypothetical protein P8I42_06945 [Flavobacteriaceae bacterium]|jgi:ketosteroid isomerase-like protein|nr:hypothetical protein [Flavobacteriaceae bacterium]MDG1912545.1 hypothetical protein [Flavobacteriaceae bacterium]